MKILSVLLLFLGISGVWGTTCGNQTCATSLAVCVANSYCQCINGNVGDGETCFDPAVPLTVPLNVTMTVYTTAIAEGLVKVMEEGIAYSLNVFFTTQDTLPNVTCLIDKIKGDKGKPLYIVGSVTGPAARLYKYQNNIGAVIDVTTVQEFLDEDERKFREADDATIKAGTAIVGTMLALLYMVSGTVHTYWYARDRPNSPLASIFKLCGFMSGSSSDDDDDPDGFKVNPLVNGGQTVNPLMTVQSNDNLS
eukprot:Colp12_sorted_trinity150504_noHs@21732